MSFFERASFEDDSLQRFVALVDPMAAMTAAVAIPSIRCFKITRRFGRRSSFRRPRPQMVELVTYGLAVAAEASGVSLHEYGIEANRLGVVLSASDAELETFIATLEAVVSEGADGTLQNWREGLAYEATPLDDDAAIVEACVDVATSAMRAAR